MDEMLKNCIADMSGYQSPIELIVEDMFRLYTEKIENGITAKVESVCGIEIDKDELLKLLTGDRDTYAQGYNNGYENGYNAALENETAHWERPYPTTPKSYTRICSRCKGTAYVIGKYEYPRCPHCGAIMRKEIEK